jgi:hypothetical protein
MTRFERWVILPCVVAPAVLFLALVLRHRHSVATEWPRIEARWETGRHRYGRVDANASAREIETLAASLGFDLVSHHGTQAAAASPRPNPKRAEAWTVVQPFLDHYLVAVESDDGEVIAEPSEQVAWFLTTFAAEVHALVTLLNSPEPPRWGPDSSDRFLAPSPAGLDALRRVLCAQTLVAERAGQRTEAQEALEAVWRLGRTMAEPLPHGSSLEALAALTTHQAAVMRKMNGLPVIWQRRLAETVIDYRRMYADMLDYQAWDMAQDLRRGFRPLPWRIWVFPRAGVRDYVIALRRAAVEVAGSAPCSTLDLEKPSLWNLPGRMGFPPEEKLLEKFDRAAMELELTWKVLELKARREASPKGEWPSGLEGIESSVCTSQRWTYAVGADGTMTLGFSRSFEGRQPPRFTAKAGLASAN